MEITGKTGSIGRKPSAVPDLQTFVARAKLLRVSGQEILFSSSRQSVFELNESGARIWRALAAGKTIQAMEADILHGGGTVEEAREYVKIALDAWQSLDLIHPALPAAPASGAHDLTQHLAISGLRLSISYPEGCAGQTAAVFQHLEVADGASDVAWEVIESHARLHVFRQREWVTSCSPDELATLLKGHFLNDILDRDGYEVAMHAAALHVGDRILLLFGEPGAGKSTLTLGLVHQGFGFGGDDVALLLSSGRCAPIPFAPALKAGAWPILKDRYPAISEAPVFRRPDRRRVRYFFPGPFSGSDDREIGWIVFLDRRATGAAKLHKVDVAEALRGLVGGSYAMGEVLTDSAFETMARTIGGSEVFRLSYSGLDGAVDVIRKACR